MKRIVGLIISLVFITTGQTFSQDVSFELSNKKFTELAQQKYYEFDVLISSQRDRRLHSGQLYFNYQKTILGQNLISKNAVTVGNGTDNILLATESGNALFKDFVLNDNTSGRISFSWQNRFSCDALEGKSIIGNVKKVLISFRVLIPAGVKPEELDLNNLICFESGELYDNQTYDCSQSIVSQILSNSFLCTDKDLIAPVSAISPATPKVVYGNSVLLSWTGSDNPGGSGIASYALYVSVDGGAFQLFASDLADTHYVFYGDKDKQYSFFVLAIDKKGNQEIEKTTGDVTVYFDSTLNVVANSLGTTIEASPNPMAESFLLKLGETIDNVQVHITNIYGQTMYYKEFGSTDSENISFQGAAGVYFVKVISGNEKSALFKILKN
jgi:hypothetical protein